MENKTPLKGYKIFNPDLTCRGFQYEIGKDYKHTGILEVCGSGFHFCLNAQDCFSYYAFDPKNIVCEVEAIGEYQTHSGDSKIATSHIKIVRQLTWDEVLKIANTGANNTGHSNSGNWNSGYSNSGNGNSGNGNSGNGNSGNGNSGNGNSGNGNSGDGNSGNGNSGNGNSGNWNSGYRNSGNGNSGNGNSGNWNSGYRNSGDGNSGNGNSGYRNSGDRNSGNGNSGYRNSGDRNSGDGNSGNWNSGCRNSGDCNSGYRNSGAFCTSPDPKIELFNKPSKYTAREWESTKAVELMQSIDTTLWIPEHAMTNEEKAIHTKWETTEGYLKTIPIKEAWKNAWGNWSSANRKAFTSLENFCPVIFEEITGIKI